MCSGPSVGILMLRFKCDPYSIGDWDSRGHLHYWESLDCPEEKGLNPFSSRQPCQNFHILHLYQVAAEGALLMIVIELPCDCSAPTSHWPETTHNYGLVLELSANFPAKGPRYPAKSRQPDVTPLWSQLLPLLLLRARSMYFNFRSTAPSMF